MSYKRIISFLVFSGLFVPFCAWAYPDTVQATHVLSNAVKSIKVSPNSRYLFSFSTASSLMDVFDTVTFSQVESYSVGHTPYDMVVSPDGLKAYMVTSKSDEIIVLDVSDPEDISQTETFSVGTSGVTFKSIARAEVSSKQYLYLTDQANHKLYAYNATDKTVVGSVDLSALNASFSPIDVAVSPDGATLGVLGSGGWFAVCLASSLAVVASIDGGQLSDPDNFVRLALGAVPGLNEVAFLLNSSPTGEIYLVNMADKLNGNLFFIDADPDDGEADTDPIIVGADSRDTALITVMNAESGESSALYLYASAGNDVLAMDTAQIGTETVDIVKTFSSVGSVNLRGIFAGSAQDAYLYLAAGDSQSIKVVSENPKITVVSPTDDVSVESGSVDFIFESDKAGTYKAVRYTGGPQDAVSSSNGTQISSGSVTADEQKTIAISTEDLVEGDNIIAVFVTSGGMTGREGFRISYDTVPAVPKDFKLSFGNAKIYVSFKRNTESDMDHYNLYFGIAQDDLNGSDGISSPVSIAHPDSGSRVNYILEPLTNDRQYFMRVTAVDRAGNESEPTATLWEVPEVTIGPIGASGETGGCGSVAAGPTASLLFVLIFLAAAFIFIRAAKKGIIAVLILALFCSPNLSSTGIASQAQGKAQSEELPKIPINGPMEEVGGIEPVAPINDGTITVAKHRFSGALKVSWFMPKDTVLKDFYGVKGNEMFGFKSTYFIWNFEIGLGLDFFTEKARMLGETSLRPSGERASLFILPITVPVYYNLRFTDTQVLVPYAKLAYSLWYYRLSEPASRVTGWVSHMVFGTGLKFNFEGLTGYGSSNKSIGIDHMFLLFEYAYNHHFNRDGGLSFSGHNWGFGVGVDY